MSYIFENLYIENFKGFKESTSIKIADINLLTGKNNAGKSSLIELFNLISSSINSDGMNYLKFSSLDNLLSFDKALNYDAKTKEISFTFPSTLKYFGENNLFHIECSFIKSINNPLDGFLKSIKYMFVLDEICETFQLVFEINNDEAKRIIKRSDDRQIQIEPNSNYYCNIPFIHSHIMKEFEKVLDEYVNTEVDIIDEDGEDKWAEIKSKEQLQKENEVIDEYFNQLPNYNDLKTSIYSKKYDKINFSKTNATLDYYSYQEYFDNETEPDNLYQRELRLSIYDYDRYYHMIAEHLDEKTLNKHKEIEASIELKGNIISPFNQIKLRDKSSIELIIYTIRIDYWKKLNSSLEKNNLPEINFLNFDSKTPLSELIFESIILEFLQPLMLYNDVSQQPTTIDLTSQNNLDYLLKHFYNKNISKETIEYSFFKFWLNEFGYGSEYKLIEENNKIVIRFDNNKELSSFGQGLNSLLKTLLAITSKAYDNYLNPVEFYSKSILILIEPESNLHPDLQSKIADLLVDATNKFNIKFIVETHSEYLIRKLQYWTSLGKIKPGATILNYFEKDNKNKTIIINQITIDEDGNLSDDFGEGFIDHAPQLMLDLLNLKKKNNLN